MNLIVVVDNEWGIGRQNGLLFRLKKDMAFFRTTTTGKVVVMGAKTFASLKNGALPDRINVVLDDSGAEHAGAITVKSVDELKQTIQVYPQDDVYVCGGASVYKLLLNDCKNAYVTKVEACGNAEVFFPNLDEKPEWELISQSERIVDDDYIIRFCKYINKNFQY